MAKYRVCTFFFFFFHRLQISFVHIRESILIKLNKSVCVHILIKLNKSENYSKPRLLAARMPRKGQIEGRLEPTPIDQPQFQPFDTQLYDSVRIILILFSISYSSLFDLILKLSSKSIQSPTLCLLAFTKFSIFFVDT